MSEVFNHSEHDQTTISRGEKHMQDSQPFLLSARDLVGMGIARSLAYQLLNRSDMPMVQIGGRKFMHRELFLDWLRNQATSDKKISTE